MEIHPTGDGRAIHSQQSRARGVKVSIGENPRAREREEIKRRREEEEKERWDRSPDERPSSALNRG